MPLTLLLTLVLTLLYTFTKGVDAELLYGLMFLLSLNCLKTMYLFAVAIVHSDEVELDTESMDWSSIWMENLIISVAYLTVGVGGGYTFFLGLGACHIGFLTMINFFAWAKGVDDIDEQ